MHSADTVEGIQAREGTQCPALCASDALRHHHHTQANTTQQGQNCPEVSIHSPLIGHCHYGAVGSTRCHSAPMGLWICAAHTHTHNPPQRWSYMQHVAVVSLKGGAPCLCHAAWLTTPGGYQGGRLCRGCTASCTPPIPSRVSRRTAPIPSWVSRRGGCLW